jgi:hypothetical protein
VSKRLWSRLGVCARESKAESDARTTAGCQTRAAQGAARGAIGCGTVAICKIVAICCKVKVAHGEPDGIVRQPDSPIASRKGEPRLWRELPHILDDEVARCDGFRSSAIK